MWIIVVYLVDGKVVGSFQFQDSILTWEPHFVYDRAVLFFDTYYPNHPTDFFMSPVMSDDEAAIFIKYFS